MKRSISTASIAASIAADEAAEHALAELAFNAAGAVDILIDMWRGDIAAIERVLAESRAQFVAEDALTDRRREQLDTLTAELATRRA